MNKKDFLNFFGVEMAVSKLERQQRHYLIVVATRMIARGRGHWAQWKACLPYFERAWTRAGGKGPMTQEELRAMPVDADEEQKFRNFQLDEELRHHVWLSGEKG